MADSRLVHLVDDDQPVRESAAFFLETADYVVKPHVSGDAFLAHIDRGLDAPLSCCVLLDIHMPGLSGLEVQMALADRRIPWPVIVVTGQAEVGVAIQAMKNGAFDFLEKPVEGDALLEILADAFQKLEQAHGASERLARAHALIARLTHRERQVMGGLLAALPNKRIAEELELSVRTVELYRAKVMTKLQVRGLSAAVRMAIDAGLEPLTEGGRHGHSRPY